MINNDTIIAQATPYGRGSVGILRISGPEANKVAKIVLGKQIKPRYAEYLAFKNINGNVIDQGIALWFPHPNSFTGEDVLELHGHGGFVVLDLLLKYILTIPGIRIAKPGEFSERAFLNNKLNLTQAEAIADLINASSEQAARSAVKTLQGLFSTRIEYIIEALVKLRVNVEASINFPDENIDFHSDEKILIQLKQVINDLNILCSKAHQGSLINEGIKIVIAGRPNVGKSSLLNALLGRESAIVTDIAGTTRDVLRECIYIDGIPIHIIDTAGLHETNDKVENIGIKFAWQEIKQADRMLLVVDGTTTDSINIADIWPEFITHVPVCLPITIVRNKSDITGEQSNISRINNSRKDCYVISLSARTGKGIDILRDHLKQSINFEFNNNEDGGSIFLARRRHLQSIKEALKCLERGKLQLINARAGELLAEELMLAQQALNEITGKFTSHDLLKKIFSSFCIGK